MSYGNAMIDGTVTAVLTDDVDVKVDVTRKHTYWREQAGHRASKTQPAQRSGNTTSIHLTSVRRLMKNNHCAVLRQSARRHVNLQRVLQKILMFLPSIFICSLVKYAQAYVCNCKYYGIKHLTNYKLILLCTTMHLHMLIFMLKVIRNKIE
jgi:hypothetical protein